MIASAFHGSVAYVNGDFVLIDAPNSMAFEPVSYTHLDVYKRQSKKRYGECQVQRESDWAACGHSR